MKTFVGRSKELGALRGVLDRERSSLVLVTGPPGIGKSALVQRVLADYAGVYFRCPPMPSPLQCRALSDALARGGVAEPEDATSEDRSVVPTWEGLAHRVDTARRQSARPWVVVLDDAERLQEARARFRPALARLRHVEEGVPPVHIVLVGRDPASIEPKSLGDDAEHISLGPLTLREAAGWLPGNQPHHRLRAYAAFGGTPRILAGLDKSVTVGTNIRRLLLDPDGSHAETPFLWLQSVVQTPSRYTAILSVLSEGRADWARIHDGVPDLSRSGQLAPYVKRLSQLGWISTHTSVDARPTSRARRYEITDPFVGFWFRFILPWRATAHLDTPASHYTRVVRPGIEHHMSSVMPLIARQHIRQNALELFGASARVSGGLWGDGADVVASGLLSNGAAFYGACVWDARDGQGERTLAELDRQIGSTRYGFGREGRLRVVFVGRPPPTALKREVARRHDTTLVDAAALLEGSR